MVGAITVDPRAGSADLFEPLKARKLPVRLSKLEAGDVAFIGNGPEGRPVPVGIEYKKLPEMLGCFRDRFAGHQLPGLKRAYEYPWLLIEGECRPHPRTGLLQMSYHGSWIEPRIKVMWREYKAALMTFELRAGIRRIETMSTAESVAAISMLYGWWTGKEWEDHRSHLAFNDDAPDDLLWQPSLKRRWAKELPGIGYEKSKTVSRHFRTPYELANAQAAEWAKIEGIGRTMAIRIVAQIRGESENG